MQTVIVEVYNCIGKLHEACMFYLEIGKSNDKIIEGRQNDEEEYMCLLGIMDPTSSVSMKCCR